MKAGPFKLWCESLTFLLHHHGINSSHTGQPKSSFPSLHIARNRNRVKQLPTTAILILLPTLLAGSLLMTEWRNDERNSIKRSLSVWRGLQVQICSVWLPGSSINLAGGSGVYLVQQAAAAAADCWLTGCRVVYTSDVVRHKESQGPANTPNLLRISPDELTFSPCQQGNTIYSFLVRRSNGMPHFGFITPTEDTVDISTFELPSLGIRGPKSVLTTDLIEPSLAKSGFIRSLGPRLPVSMSGNRLWERCMLSHCFGSFFQAMFTYNPPPWGLGREWKEVKYIVYWTDYITVQSLLLRHLVSLIVRAFFFFCCLYCFHLSSGLFAPVQGAELNFLFNICHAAWGGYSS